MQNKTKSTGSSFACLPQCAFDRAISVRVRTRSSIGSTVAIVGMAILGGLGAYIIPLHIVSVDKGQESRREGDGVGYESGEFTVAGFLGGYVDNGGDAVAPGEGGGEEVDGVARDRVRQRRPGQVRQRAE